MTPGRHPYFDDQRTTYWYPSLEEALTAAQETGRRVLVLVGRRTCGGSRALIEKTLPKEEIAEFVNGHYICIAAEAEGAAPGAPPSEPVAVVDSEDRAALMALMEQAPRREPTPLCLYVSAAGRLLHSTVGGRPAAVFLRDLTEAQAKPA